MRRPKHILVVMLIMSLAGAGVWAARRHSVPEYEPAVMKPFSSNLRTHCIGRYLIDLPDDFGDPLITRAVWYFGLDKNFKEVEAEFLDDASDGFQDFRRVMTAYFDKLKTTKHSELNIPLLQHSEIVATPYGDALLFRKLDPSDAPSTLTSELHVYINGQHVKLWAESFPHEELYFKDKDPLYRFVDPTASEDRLKRFAVNLRPAVTRPGADNAFCIRGVVFDPQRIGYDEEKATFNYERGNEEDAVSLTIGMRGKTGQSKDTLFETYAGQSRIFARLMAGTDVPGENKVTRHATRKIAGMNFQEIGLQLHWFKSKNSQFRYIAKNRQEKSELSFYRPAITLNFDSGAFAASESASPLSLYQVEQSWDQWLLTLRPAGTSGAETSR